MSQSRVTDYFTTSRKNVKRSQKKVAAPIVSRSPTPTTAKKTSQVSGVKRSDEERFSSYNQEDTFPAFKRFRHLVPADTSKSDNADASSEPSTGNEQTSNASTQHVLEQGCRLSDKNEHVFTKVTKKEHVSSPSKVLPSSSAINPSSAPISPSKSISPKSSPSKAPAFQRFAHLVPSVPKPSESVPSLPSLPLPFAYKNLNNIFKTMDNVCSMIFARKELISFSKLQDAVKKVVHREFNESTFGQVKAIYGNSYSARYEKNVPKFGRKVSAKYELIIDVNLKEDETLMSKSEESRMTFNGTRLIQRRETFLSKIMKILLNKHQEFLCKELNMMPADLPPSSSLKRWHPKFPLDRIEVPEPEPMPLRPDINENRILSAQEAVSLFKKKGMTREVNLCERAVLKLGGTLSQPKSSVTVNEKKKNNNRIPGVSQSLLEKIRAKEAAKAADILSRGGLDWEKRQAMLSRLPDLAIHTWNLFATSRKPVLSINYLCEKIADSHPSGLSQSSIHDHLRLLSQTLPDWLELLDWATPHARILDLKRNLADVRSNLVKHIGTVGI